MNEEALNMSVRKFLKTVGVTSQRQIEQAVRAAAEGGSLPGDGRLTAKVVLSIPELGLTVQIDGTIETE